MRRIVAHEPRRRAGARGDVRRDAHDRARVRDLRRRARVAARLPEPHDAPALTRVVPDPRTPQRPLRAGQRAAPPLPAARHPAHRRLAVLRRGRARARRARGGATRARPESSHVLLVGSGVNFIDVAGCELLVQDARYVARRRRHAVPVQPEARRARGARARRLPRRVRPRARVRPRPRRSARSTRGSMRGARRCSPSAPRAPGDASGP